jgi:hypothetical protein
MSGLKVEVTRHSRAGGNPDSTVDGAMQMDSRLRGNDRMLGTNVRSLQLAIRVYPCEICLVPAEKQLTATVGLVPAGI